MVLVSPKLEEELYQNRLSKLPNETGGVLIGSIDFYKKIIYCVSQIYAPADSKEYPSSFVRGCNGLKQELDRIHNCTRGNLEYIGEWHSHPNSHTGQSCDDKKLLKEIADYNILQGAPGLMMIVGKDHIDIYISSNTQSA
jgi:integrative and conjugative element protein (TIGR02256 family)